MVNSFKISCYCFCELAIVLKGVQIMTLTRLIYNDVKTILCYN